MFELKQRPYNNNTKQLYTACASANHLLTDKEFGKKVMSFKSSFEYSKLNGEDVWAIMSAHSNKVMKVCLYTTKNPWSKAMGYWSPLKPDHIFLNSRKFPRSIDSLVASLCHEYTHYCSSLSTEKFDHGNNYYTIAKANSAPYWIGDRAGEYVAAMREEAPTATHNEVVNIVTYTPFHWKVVRFFKRLFRIR